MRKNRKNPRHVVAVLFSTLLMTGGTLAAVTPLVVEPPTVEEAAAIQQSGDFEAASAAWSAIVEAEPDNGVAWFNLGFALHAAGHLEKAKGVHRKAASFDRFRGIALYNLGCAHALLGEHDAAFEALAAASEAGFDVRGSAGGDSDFDSIRQDPRYAAMMGATSQADSRSRGDSAGGGGGFSMGGGKERLGELFETVGMHMQPIIEELMPEFEQRVGMLMQEAQQHAHELFGMLKQRVDENDELVSALQEIHQILSEDPQIGPLLEKAHAWMEQNMGGGGGPSASHGGGSASSSGAVASRAPSSDADSAPAAEGITFDGAQRLQQAGQHQAAAHAFAVLGKQHPDDARAAFGYAYNLHMTGSYESAIAAHKAAAQFEAVRGISLYNLACACALTGRTHEAIEALNAAVEAGGFNVGGSMGNDSDLDSLRNDKRFIELQERLSGGE